MCPLNLGRRWSKPSSTSSSSLSLSAKPSSNVISSTFSEPFLSSFQYSDFCCRDLNYCCCFYQYIKYNRCLGTITIPRWPWGSQLFSQWPSSWWQSEKAFLQQRRLHWSVSWSRFHKVITDQWMWLFPGGTIYYRHSVGFPPKSHSAPLITLGGSLLPIHVTISLQILSAFYTICPLHSGSKWLNFLKFKSIMLQMLFIKSFLPENWVNAIFCIF